MDELERVYLRENIKELVESCKDIDLLYLIKILLEDTN